MIPLERYNFNLNIFPPLNFNESISSEKKEESHFIHQENVEINTHTPPDLNQPSLNSGEGGGVLFREKEQSEILHPEQNRTDFLSEQTLSLISEKAQKHSQIIGLKYLNYVEENQGEVTNRIMGQLFEQKCQEGVQPIRPIRSNLQDVWNFKILDGIVSFLDLRKFISTCLKIKKRWNEFVEMLSSSQPFLYEAGGFVLKGCKGCTIGLINPIFNLSGTLNIGANEAIREIFHPLTQAINTLQEKVCKHIEKNQIVSQEDAESYRDKYFAVLEENNAILKDNKATQDKLIAELEEGKALRDKNIEFLEDSNAKKDKVIAEMSIELQAQKVNAIAEKPLSAASSVVSNEGFGREKTFRGRKRAFSQPQLVTPI